MRKTMGLIVGMAMLFGCQKTGLDIGNSNSPASYISTFSFKANDTLYQWDGSLAENAKQWSSISKKYTELGSPYGNSYVLDAFKVRPKGYYTLEETGDTPGSTEDNRWALRKELPEMILD